MADDVPKPPHEESDLFIDPLGGIEIPDASELNAPEPLAEFVAEESSFSSEPEPVEIGDAISDVQLSSIDAGTETNVQEVGALLAAALPNEEPPAYAENADPDSDERARIFDVTIRGLADPRSQKQFAEILQRLPLAEKDPNLETKIAELGAYRISRISEFYANALALQLHKAGLEFHLGIPHAEGEPEPNGSDLIGVGSLDAEKSSSQGAFAVAMPEKPGEILLSTVETVPGYAAALNKGIVTAHGSVARAFFREEEKLERLQHKVSALAPGSKPERLKLPRAEMDKIFQSLLERLQREAFRRGANGVIGIQISGFSESASFDPEADQIRLIATGTAVLLEPTK